MIEYVFFLKVLTVMYVIAVKFYKDFKIIVSYISTSDFFSAQVSTLLGGILAQW